MKEKTLLIFITIFVFSLTTKAQNYDGQYKICSESLSKLSFVDSLYFDLAKKRDSCLLGVSASNFQATTIDNEKIELSKLKGKVVVLNFWFTGCQPCIAEMPGFNKLVETFSNKKVAFISFTYESSATVLKFLKQHPFNFKNVTDNDAVRREDFKLFSVWPYTIIISKEGKIAFMQFGTKGAEAFSFFDNIIKSLL